MALRRILLLAFLPETVAQLKWTLVQEGNYTTDGPMPRRDAAMTYDADRDKVVVFGGRLGDDTGLEMLYGDTWIYDVSSKKWRAVETVPSPGRRFNSVFGKSGSYFYVVMGEGNKTIYNDVWRFDLENETWKELSTGYGLSTEGRADAVGGIFEKQSRLYLALGTSGGREFLDIYANSGVLSYDVNSNNWFKEFDNPSSYSPDHPHNRVRARGVMIAPDELFVFGGCMNPGPCPTGDSWIFNGRHKMWQAQLPHCLSPKMYPAIAMLPQVNNKKQLVVYGSDAITSQVLLNDKPALDEVGILDVHAKSWSIRKVAGKAPSARFSSSAATGKDGVFIFGGYDGVKSYNDLWHLDGTGDDANNSPTSPCKQSFFSLIMLHGTMMTLGWGFFIQWGGFTARYGTKKSVIRVPIHLTFQIFGYLVALVGFGCAVCLVQFHHFRSVHGILGLIVMVIGLQQFLNGIPGACRLVREGENDARTTCWRWWHKNSGRIALVLSLINISLGVFIGDAGRLLWGLWFGYLAFIVLIYLITECVVHQFKKYPDSTASYNLSDDEEYVKKDRKSKDIELAYLHEGEEGGIDNPAMEVNNM